MNQSTYIAAALLAAFVLYLAARNRLSTYAAVLWGPTAQPVPGADSGGGPSPAQAAGSQSLSDIAPQLPGNLGDVATMMEVPGVSGA